MYDVCDIGAMPDVRRSDRAEPHEKSVIPTMNPKAGCAGSVLNLLQMAAFNHQVEIEKGVLEEECSMMLSDFFRELREKKKRKKQETVTESL